MKKTWATMVSVILVIAMLAGCSSKTPSSSPSSSGESQKSAETGAATKDPITLNLFVDLLTTRGSNNDPAVKEIEKRLLKDKGINVKLNFIGSEHVNAFQTINMKLAANELDAFSMAQDGSLTSEFMTKGMTIQLDDLLKDYPNITKQVSEDVWPHGTYEGKKYLFPLKPPVRAYIFPWIRKDLLDKVSLPIPKTIDEFGAAIKKIKETDKNFLGYSAAHVGWIFTQTFGMGYDASQWVKDGNLTMTVSQGLGGALQPESDYWKRWMLKMQQFYKDGVINKEVFTMKQDQMPDLVNSGRLIALADGFSFQQTADRLAGLDPKNPLPADAKKQEWVMTPLEDEGRPTTWCYGPTASTFIGIAKNSKHPKEVLAVLDWMSENTDNFTLARYGIEGSHYDKVDGSVVPKAPNGGVPLYDGALGRFAGPLHGEAMVRLTSHFVGKEWEKALDPNTKFWYTADAFVSYAPVKSKDILPNLEQIGHEYFVNTVSGQIPVDDQSVKKLIDDLKKAGIEQSLAESNEQYHAAKKRMGIQ